MKGIWWLGLAVTAGGEDRDGEADMTEKSPDADMLAVLSRKVCAG